MFAIPLVNHPDPFFVDAEDYEAVLAFSRRWYRRPEGSVYTTVRTSKGPRRVPLVRFLLGEGARYADGNALNLSRANLLRGNKGRVQRKTVPKPLLPACRNAHGLAGVQRRPSGSWTSRARIRGKLVCTGIWPTKEAAHAAYVALKTG